MNKCKLERGTKVVPHDKSAGYFIGLTKSNEWEKALIKKQPYLYVYDDCIHDGKEVLKLSYNLRVGSCDTEYFDYSDVELYIEEEIQMKKSDLKVGMVVENREGDRGIILQNANGELAVVRQNTYGDLSSYDDNLIKDSINNKRFDIMKVYEIKDFGSLNTLLSSKFSLTLIWERKDNSKEIDEIKKNIANVEENLKSMKEQLSRLERGDK